MSLNGHHVCQCGRPHFKDVLPSKCCGLEGEFGSESIIYCPLHAAAPELLEGVKTLVSVLTLANYPNGEKGSKLIKHWKAAIAKAEGKE